MVSALRALLCAVASPADKRQINTAAADNREIYMICSLFETRMDKYLRVY